MGTGCHFLKMGSCDKVLDPLFANIAHGLGLGLRREREQEQEQKQRPATMAGVVRDNGMGRICLDS